VPVVAVESRSNRLGGAANVALNLRSLGAEPIMISVSGNDTMGEELVRLLQQDGIDSERILRLPARKTTVKYRIIGNRSQMLRVDEESAFPLDTAGEDAILQAAGSAFSSDTLHAVILQDYNKGVLTPRVIREITGMASQQGIPVCVDPKRENFLEYRNATLFKPNLKELREGLNLTVAAENRAELDHAADLIHDRYGIEFFMLTLSEKGVYISRRVESNTERHLVPAFLRNVADVSGAGDTVISVAALCLASGLSPLELVTLANLAGGLVCEEPGVVPVNRERLLQEALRLHH
jgi:rfaE bifunctional protein kinase chain/domain